MSRSLVLGVSAGLLGLVGFGVWWERRQRLAAQAEWRRVLPDPPPVLARQTPIAVAVIASESEPLSAAGLSAQPTEAAPRALSIDDEDAGAPEDLGLAFLRGATETAEAHEDSDFFGFHVQEGPLSSP